MSEYESKTKIKTLPKKYYDAGFNNYNFKPDSKDSIIRDTCWDYANGISEKPCLVLTGKVGTGKTHLAVAIAKNIPEKISDGGYKSKKEGYKTYQTKQKSVVRFLIADELFAQFNDLAYEQKSKLDFIKGILLSDLIIIDDLGVANFSPAKQENLYLLINRIYLEEKRMILTTNFTMEQLDKVDARIPSRLAEMSKIILFDQKDYRKR